MLRFILKLIVGLVLLIVIAGLVRSFMVDRSPSQAVFLAGTLPNPSPEGFYKGTVSAFHVPWIGKKFDKASSTGVNVFNTGSASDERYPFKTYEGKGLTDATLNVLDIDYNVPANPLWMHPVLDEIVQVGPDHYLGKLHVRIFSWLTFTLGFFELQK